MSILAMNWVWNHSDSKGADRLVLLYIADRANDNGGGAWPSQTTLADRANVSRRSVQRSIDNLVRLGELEVVEHGGGTKATDPRHRPNLYRLRMDKRRHCDASTDLRGDIDDVKGRHPDRLGATPTSHEPSLNHPEPSAQQGATFATCGVCSGENWTTEDDGLTFAPCSQCSPSARTA